MIKRFQLVNIPGVIFIIFAVILFLSLWSGSTIRFSNDIEQFFPQGDQDLDVFYTFREQFETDDNFLLIALPSDSGVFHQEYLESVDSLSKDVAQINSVTGVSALTNARYFVKSYFGVIVSPFLHIDKPERYGKDSLRIMKDERLVGSLIDDSASTLVIYIKTVDTISQESAENLIDSVEQSLAWNNLPQHHLLGRAYFQTELVEDLQTEFSLMLSISAILVVIVFFFLFRSLRAVVIGLVSVLLSMMVFIGFLGLTGRPLDIMSVMYPILMIIVGVSDVVHVMTKYRDELARGKDQLSAIKITLKEIGLATFLTSFTTGIGFLTLLTSVILPVKMFGLFSAVGVIIAYFTVITFTTSLLVVFPLSPKKIEKDDRWTKYLTKVYRMGIEHPKRIAIIALVILAGSIYGVSQISTDVHLVNGLPKRLKATQDFHFFERTFGGFRPFEVIAIVNDTSKTIRDYEVLREMDKMEQHLKSYDGISNIQSITTVYKSLNRAVNGDKFDAYQLPPTEKEFKKIASYVSRVPDDQLDVMISSDEKFGRISAKINDLGTDSIAVVSSQIRHFIQSEVDTALVRFELTGTGILYDKNNEYLRENLVYGLSIAFVIISLVMSLLYRNIKYVVISLIPNIFPLLICAAVIGFFKIELDAPTSIIFAISFGIAVDDTIHFLSKFKLERNKGLKVEQALQNTILETGKAIIVTSIILFFGFAALITSDKQATLNVGLLVSITLFTAVIADLFLIPLMIRSWIKDK